MRTDKVSTAQEFLKIVDVMDRVGVSHDDQMEISRLIGALSATYEHRGRQEGWDSGLEAGRKVHGGQD